MKSLRVLPIEDSSACSNQGSKGVYAKSNGGGPDLREFAGRAALVTLGCAKNQVDSEVMLGVLEQSGFEIVQEPADADVIVVNTCGFLESALRESIDAILEVAEYKETGRLRRLLVAGCMVERYKGELEENFPEVDGFLGIDDLLKVGDFASGDFGRSLEGAGRPYFLYDETMPRKMSTLGHTAYVKISEGCNRPCTFCIIPRLRGAMRSRMPDSVVAEVKALSEAGVREINLVGQDLTAYGEDLASGKYPLWKLLQDLDSSGGVEWIRLLYGYPLGITPELLAAIRDLPRVCSYLDIPLQHSSESVLRRMRRPLGKCAPRKLVEQIKAIAPSVKLRTTFIVGFPGETEEDIADLVDFVAEGHFSSVGVFTYSQEVGTPSYDLEGQLEQEVKDERRARVMEAQSAVLNKLLPSFVGQILRVMLEGAHQDTDLLLQGRAEFQAPEVDGVVIINDVSPDIDVQTGEFYDVEITDVAGYDLVGRIVARKS